MCLSSVQFALERTEDGLVGVGYKYLLKYNNKLSGSDYLPCDFNQNDWLKSGGPQKLNPVKYIRGFHLFLNASDAKKYNSDNNSVVAKFLYKDVLSFGQQQIMGGYAPCVVVDQIKFAGLVNDVGPFKISELVDGNYYELKGASLDGQIRKVEGNRMVDKNGTERGRITDSVYLGCLFTLVEE